VKPTDSADALRIAAGIGPYFVVEHVTDDSGWIALASLIDNADLLGERVHVVRTALSRVVGGDLAKIEPRVAASTHALALVSRLAAPAVATGALTSTVVAPVLGEVFWRPVDRGPVPFAYRCPELVRAESPDELATAIHDHVIAPIIAPLVDAFADTFHLSHQVLWGNVASAIAGAATMIRSARPDHAADAIELAAALTSTPMLAGSGQYRETDGQRFFIRNNCCLFYRIPGGGFCGDCVLRSAS